jgi:hypothetical protein
MNTVITNAILLRSLVLFLMLGSVAGVLAGGLMLWRPEWLASINQYLNRWVSTRKMSQPLDQTVDMDHWFYRYGRISGVLLLAGAIYIVYIFTAAQGRANFLSGLNGLHMLQPALLESLLDTMVLIFLAGAILSILLSMFLIFRPSMLRDFEVGANQRISIRRSLKPMEIQNQNLDKLVFHHARLAGILVLVASLYTLVALALWLAR